MAVNVGGIIDGMCQCMLIDPACKQHRCLIMSSGEVPPTLVRQVIVAAAQITAVPDIRANATAIARCLSEAARQGAEVVVLPEASLTGYYPNYIRALSPDQLDAGMGLVRQACRDAGVFAIVGSPVHRAGGRVTNGAVVIDRDGQLIGVQDKLQLVPGCDDWASPGTQIQTFCIPLACGGTLPAAAVICHDIRFPEVTRLQALAGARCIFYLSVELGHDDQPMPLDDDAAFVPYTAQVQARAVENQVFLVHANMAADPDRPGEGSHGRSKIVDPSGMVMDCAPGAGVYVLCRSLDLSRATAIYATESTQDDYFLAGWWRSALSSVTQMRTDTCPDTCWSAGISTP
eukprot:gene11615-2113_t